MEVRFLIRNIETDQKSKDRMTSKLEKLEKFFDKIISTQVSLSKKRGMISAEITADVNGVMIRGEDSASDLQTAFDKAMKKIERQVKKHKETLRKKGRLRLQDIELGVDDDYDYIDKFEITKTKSFRVEEMTPEEAVMQMDLLGHEFYVFRNSQTGEINVVYKRIAGDYGLIEPR